AESMKDRQIRAPREPLPIRERLPRHPRVDLVGSIGGSRQARLTARGGASIAGPLGVEEQHPLPLAKQIPRGPTAEDARSDDDHVPVIAPWAALLLRPLHFAP